MIEKCTVPSPVSIAVPPPVPPVPVVVLSPVLVVEAVAGGHSLHFTVQFNILRLTSGGHALHFTVQYGYVTVSGDLSVLKIERNQSNWLRKPIDCTGRGYSGVHSQPTQSRKKAQETVRRIFEKAFFRLCLKRDQST